MKIAFLSRYQNINERGAESFVKELGLRLAKRHTVDILTGKDSDSFKKVLAGNYDIVIPINGRTQSLKFSLGRLFKKYKLLISGHAGRGWDDIWNIAIAKPDLFVGLTDLNTRWAQSWAWGSKIIKIPNGIDLIKFKPKGPTIDLSLPHPIILSVGALVWYKHHDRVIDAVSKTAGSLLIVGKGPLEKELQKKAEEKLNNRYIIKSFKYEDMPKIYRSVDIFTLPSWDREAFGLVYLEALASGLGVVAPDDSSRKEIIGNAGEFVDTSDINLYASSLNRVLEKKWTQQARQQAEKFSWDKIALEYENAMLELLKK